MRHIIFVTVLLLLSGAFLASPAVAAETAPEVNRNKQAYELLQKADKMFRGTKMETTMTMEVHKNKTLRTFRIHSVEKDRKTSLVRILEPRRDRGTAFLKTGGKLWMYTPKVRRTIPIPAAMMGNSFMGSDVSYDDMSRESDVLKDFDVSYAGSESCGQTTCWIINMIPHEDTPVAFDKEVVFISVDGLYRRIDYMDDEGVVVKRMLFQDYKTENGRPYPRRWEFQNLENEGRKTVIIVDKIDFDHKYKDRFFSKAALREFRP